MLQQHAQAVDDGMLAGLGLDSAPFGSLADQVKPDCVVTN